MGQFSTEIYNPPGSTLSSNQHVQLIESEEASDITRLSPIPSVWSHQCDEANA
jgi:hypothetical protein